VANHWTKPCDDLQHVFLGPVEGVKDKDRWWLAQAQLAVRGNPTIVKGVKNNVVIQVPQSLSQKGDVNSFSGADQYVPTTENDGKIQEGADTGGSKEAIANLQSLALFGTLAGPLVAGEVVHQEESIQVGGQDDPFHP
jgi:hypothetical protein